MERAQGDLNFIRPNVAAFNALPSYSIHYALMERPVMHEIGILTFAVARNAGWPELGTWDDRRRVPLRDGEGDAIVGDTPLNDSQNTLLMRTHRLVAHVGLVGAGHRRNQQWRRNLCASIKRLCARFGGLPPSVGQFGRDVPRNRRGSSPETIWARAVSSVSMTNMGALRGVRRFMMGRLRDPYDRYLALTLHFPACEQGDPRT